MYNLNKHRYRKQYMEGFIAFLQGKYESNNPYKQSGHERDTTYDDERHYYWYSGYNAYEDPTDISRCWMEIMGMPKDEIEDNIKSMQESEYILEKEQELENLWAAIKLQEI